MMTERTALVTGASSGIGFELARLLAASGHHIVAVARRRDRLASLAEQLKTHGVAVYTFERDLSVPRASPELWAELTRRGITVDVLVNNAGTAAYGLLAEQDEDGIARMLNLNVTALTSLTRLALPGMLARHWGRILNVASVAAYQPGGPRMAAYYATKSYVLSFSKGLAGELRGTGVSVTALCPGPSQTEFEVVAGVAGTRLYRWMVKSTAKDVAQAGYRALMRQSGVNVPGLTAKALAFGGGIPPRRVALEVNRLLLREA